MPLVVTSSQSPLTLNFDNSVLFRGNKHSRIVFFETTLLKGMLTSVVVKWPTQKSTNPYKDLQTFRHKLQTSQFRHFPDLKRA